MSKGATDTGTPPPSAQDVILGLALGYLPSRGLHVANELGIADLLKDGFRPIAELACGTGAHQQSLYRLLRMLAGYGVFEEESPGSFRLNPAAAVLQTQVPESLHDAVKMVGDMTGDRSWWNATAHLRHSVLTGEPAFNYVHGPIFFEYLTQHPEAGRWFAGVLRTSPSRRPPLSSARMTSHLSRESSMWAGAREAFSSKL
jgi:hypothetical protein